MNPSQRQMIKEAYQAGYREALDENIFSGAAKAATKFGKFLRKLFRGKADDVADNVTPPPPPPPRPAPKPNPLNPDDPFGRGPTRLSAAEDRYLRNLQDRVSDLEDEIVEQMSNDGREIINNMNTFGKNLPDEQKINYYRDILRREAEDLPDINNPLDDLP